MTVSVLGGLCALVLSLGVGVYTGYRYAMASREMDAMIQRTLSRLDMEREFS